MTTLYKPVNITTAEQAEALPDAAIVIGVETGERYTRSFEGDWWGVTEMGTRLVVDLDAGDAVAALVPIEAEEERGVDPWAITAWGEPQSDPLPERRRYITEWEKP